MKYKASEIDFEYWPTWMKALSYASIPVLGFICSISDICFF